MDGPIATDRIFVKNARCGRERQTRKKVTMEIKNLKMTCWACPVQWECHTDGGRMLYVRFRHGRFTINISPVPTDDVRDAVRGEIIHSEILAECFDLTWEDVMRRLDKIELPRMTL